MGIISASRRLRSRSAWTLMAAMREFAARHTGKSPVGATVADFWGWSRSDLLDNTERGVLAEFIVATALDIPADGVRQG
jgi:hypothetical protein